MSAQRKRSRTEYEEDDTHSHHIGVAQTLSILRGENISAEAAQKTPSTSNAGEHETNVDDAATGGEWEVAGPKRKKKKSSGSKKKAKQQNQTGKGNYPEIGHSSHARLQTQVRIGDLQGLVLYLLADGPSPQWCSVKHHAEIKKVVVVMVPGLEKSMFDGSMTLAELAELDSKGGEVDSSSTEVVTSRKPVSPDEYYPLRLREEDLPETLKPMARMFPHIYPVKTPGDNRMNRMHSPMASMLQAAIPKSAEDKDRNAKGPGPPRGEKNWKDQSQPITAFLATREQLSENEYVLHPALLTTDEEKASELARRHSSSQDIEHGWVDSPASLLDPSPPPSNPTKDASSDPTAGKRILALDCEMCMTGPSEFSLTRISCLNWDGSVLFDDLVKPAKPITDYLTPYSGITAAILDPVTTTLADIQAKLLPLLTTDTIIVGHSLNSDMNALQLTHPNLVDTSILYPHPRGPPLKSSLKWLSQKYLSQDIQKNGAKGHNSIEDARAALDLVKQKCKRGVKWGTSEATNESIFKRVGRSLKPGRRSDTTLLDAQLPPSRTTHNVTACVDWGVPSRGYGGSADICIGCTSDAEVVEGVLRAVSGDEDGKEVPGGGVEFVWARLRELEAVRGWWRSSKLKETDALREKAIAVATVRASAAAEAALTEAAGPENGKERIKVNGHDLFEPAAAVTAAVTAAVAATPSSAIPNETSTSTSNPPDTPTPTHTALLTSTLHTTLTHLTTLHASLPPCTALLIYSGSGDPRPLSRLQDQHAQHKREYASKKWDEIEVRWTEKEEGEIERALERARQGVGFVVVK